MNKTFPITSIAIVVVVFATSSVTFVSGIELEQVCSKQNSQPIVTLEDAREILSQFKENPRKCEQLDLHQSFIEFEKLFNELLGSKDVCNLKFLNNVQDFKLKFVNAYAADKTKEEIKYNQVRLASIPKSLSDFFIGLMSDLGQICMKQLKKRFDLELRQEVFPERELSELTNSRIKLRRLIGDFEEHLVPKALSDIVVLRKQADNKLHVVTSSKRVDLYRINNGCGVKYNGIAEEIFLPTIKLLNILGYNPTSENVAAKEFKPWLSSIETCQLYKNVDLILDTRVFKKHYALNDEEASKLKDELANAKPVETFYKETPDTDVTKPVSVEHVPVEFNQLTKNQSELNKLVRKFHLENEKLMQKNNLFNLKELFGEKDVEEMKEPASFDVFGANQLSAYYG